MRRRKPPQKTARRPLSRAKNQRNAAARGRGGLGRRNQTTAAVETHEADASVGASDAREDQAGDDGEPERHEPAANGDGGAEAANGSEAAHQALGVDPWLSEPEKAAEETVELAAEAAPVPAAAEPEEKPARRRTGWWAFRRGA